jgi:hypothetical protein
MNRATNNPRASQWWRRTAVVLGLLCAVPAAVAQPLATAAPATPACASVTVPVTLDLLVPATVHGTLCRPAGVPAGPGPVALLVSGATYNSLYWDGEGVPSASYVLAATALGMTTLAIDPIGTGQSTRPLLSALVTATGQANVVHQVVTALHHGTVDGQRHAQVALVGHSLGSMESLIEAATYHDIIALVLTGFTHLVSVVSLVAIFAGSLRPADLVGFPGLDPGWLTTAPGTRGTDFHAAGDVDPAVVAADEANRDVVAATTVPDGIGAALDPLVTGSLTGLPVLEVDGGADTIFCGPLTPGCPTSADLYHHEQAAYPGTLATFVVPDAGHDVALARDGNQAAMAIQRWLGAAESGHAETGPLPAIAA